MKISAISDLHIDAWAKTDTFGHGEDDFLRLLDGLEATSDQIVLSGDIYQTDHGWIPGGATRKKLLKRAQDRLASFTRRTVETPYVWVHGNHDAVTAEVLGAHTSVVMGGPDFRVLFTHGDCFDPVLQAAPRLSHTGTWCAGRIRAAGLRGLAEHLEDQDVNLKARRHQRVDGPFVMGARALMASQGVAAVVMGHTHVPLRTVVPEGVVANTGTCSRGRFMGVRVDTDTGEVAVF